MNYYRQKAIELECVWKARRREKTLGRIHGVIQQIDVSSTMGYSSLIFVKKSKAYVSKFDKTFEKCFL